MKTATLTIISAIVMVHFSISVSVAADGPSNGECAEAMNTMLASKSRCGEKDGSCPGRESMAQKVLNRCDKFQIAFHERVLLGNCRKEGASCDPEFMRRTQSVGDKAYEEASARSQK